MGSPQLEDREVVVLVMALASAWFVVRRRDVLESIPAWRALALAFAFRLLAYVLTVVESFVPSRLTMAMDLGEHGAALAGSLLLAGWVVAQQRRRAGRPVA